MTNEQESQKVENESSKLKAKIKPPRLNGQKIGLFATRTPHRPNPIGLSLCQIDSVDVKNGIIVLSGSDIIDGTPILDIKPFISEYDQPKLFVSGSSGDSTVVANQEQIIEPNWVKNDEIKFPNLKVDLTPRAFDQLEKIEFSENSVFKLTEKVQTDQKDHDENKRRKVNHNLPQHKQNFLKAVYEIFKSDPRSIYRKAKTPDRLFFTEIDSIKVTAWFDDEDPNEIRCEILRFLAKN